MHPTGFQAITRSVRLHAKVTSSKALRGKGPLLSLEHFMQRQRAIALFRDITRSISKIPKSPTKTEMREFARTEFERHREVTDIGHIRYLISTGRTQFDGMRRYIDEQVL